MNIFKEIVELKPKELFTVITPIVNSVIDKSGIKDGICLIHTYHTTGNIKILENELLLKQDMMMFLERVAPKTSYYAHNDIANRNVPPDERLNGHSHIWSLMFTNQETIPIVDGRLDLGTWQSLFFIDTDLGKQGRRFGITILY